MTDAIADDIDWYDDGDWEYPPEASPWANPILMLKDDNNLECSDARCTCEVNRISKVRDERFGSTEVAFRWAPTMPAVRFGAP